jgi:hypothetical protein
MIEKKTDELRQVLHERRKPVDGGAVVYWQVESRWHSVQQKWLVQNGSPYSPPMNGRPDSELDEFMGIVDGRAMWQPMKAEWRDLTTVTEEEARKDSQL